MNKTVYIRFDKPSPHDLDADPPVDKIWDDGKKPNPKLADGRTFVYEQTDAGAMINERVWDGKE